MRINVWVDSEDLKNLLYERLKFWTDNCDDDEVSLLEDYLDSLVDGGCFDGGELDIPIIVDNIYVNDTYFCYEGDEDWKRLHIGEDSQDDSVIGVRNGVALIDSRY